MAANKTVQTDASVRQYLDAIKDETRRRDCDTLVAMLQRVSGKEPRMWGTSIIGFGSYHYKYASGREGDSCLLGLSSRAAAITLYGMGGIDDRDDLLTSLGKHTRGKGCLYIKRVADVNLEVLESLVRTSVERLLQLRA